MVSGIREGSLFSLAMMMAWRGARWFVAVVIGRVPAIMMVMIMMMVVVGRVLCLLWVRAQVKVISNLGMLVVTLFLVQAVGGWI